jgi:hypothetical protein
LIKDPAVIAMRNISNPIMYSIAADWMSYKEGQSARLAV